MDKKERQRKNKHRRGVSDFVWSIKEDAVCELCGESRTECLDFHHRSPDDKDFGLSDCKQSYSKVLSEIKKCMVICANCHRVLHYRESELIKKREKIEEELKNVYLWDI